VQRRDVVRKQVVRRQGERHSVVRPDTVRVNLDRHSDGPVFAIGLDLGQSQDYTAVAVVRCVSGAELGETNSNLPYQYHLRFLKRFPLGTPYPSIIAGIEEMLGRKALVGRSRLIVDSTGVGTPVVDGLYERGLKPLPVIITGSDRPSWNKKTLCVPKRDLVATLSTLFQNDILRFPPDIQLREELIKELTNFTMRITKNARDTYSPLQHSQHDDLVIALALACYYLERQRRRPRYNLRLTTFG
jgi:hypothetical protein